MFSLKGKLVRQNFCRNNRINIEVSVWTSGVVVHVGFTLATWNDGRTEAPVQFATFTSDNKPLKVDCEVGTQLTLFAAGSCSVNCPHEGPVTKKIKRLLWGLPRMCFCKHDYYNYFFKKSNSTPGV